MVYQVEDLRQRLLANGWTGAETLDGLLTCAGVESLAPKGVATGQRYSPEMLSLVNR